MNNSKRLGRGLEALLGRAPGETVPAGGSPAGGVPSFAAPAASSDASVRIDSVDANPFQPRRDFSAEQIAELATSLAEHGLLQPIVVRRHGERFQLIAGERRLRAATKLGWSSIPAAIREADDRQMAELAIVENLQRKDLNPLEKAASFQDYLQRYGCTQEELAKRLGLDRSTVANLIRLLELPPTIQESLRQGLVTQGHARALLALGDEQQQVQLCRQIQSEGLSVRAVEEMVAQINLLEDEGPHVVPMPGKKAKGRTKGSAQLAALEQELRSATGCKVQIRQGTQGRGKVTIHFANHDDFERLQELLLGPDSQRHVG